MVRIQIVYSNLVSLLFLSFIFISSSMLYSELGWTVKHSNTALYKTIHMLHYQRIISDIIKIDNTRTLFYQGGLTVARKYSNGRLMSDTNKYCIQSSRFLTKRHVERFGSIYVIQRRHLVSPRLKPTVWTRMYVKLDKFIENNSVINGRITLFRALALELFEFIGTPHQYRLYLRHLYQQEQIRIAFGFHNTKPDFMTSSHGEITEGDDMDSMATFDIEQRNRRRARERKNNLNNRRTGEKGREIGKHNVKYGPPGTGPTTPTTPNTNSSNEINSIPKEQDIPPIDHTLDATELKAIRLELDLTKAQIGMRVYRKLFDEWWWLPLYNIYLLCRYCIHYCKSTYIERNREGNPQMSTIELTDYDAGTTQYDNFNEEGNLTYTSIYKGLVYPGLVLQFRKQFSFSKITSWSYGKVLRYALSEYPYADQEILRNSIIYYFNEVDRHFIASRSTYRVKVMENM